jgi:hypothetical protein
MLYQSRQEHSWRKSQFFSGCVLYPAAHRSNLLRASSPNCSPDGARADASPNADGIARGDYGGAQSDDSSLRFAPGAPVLHPIRFQKKTRAMPAKAQTEPADGCAPATPRYDDLKPETTTLAVLEAVRPRRSTNCAPRPTRRRKKLAREHRARLRGCLARLLCLLRAHRPR